MGNNIFYYSFRYFLFLVLVLALSYSFYPNELPESADSDSPQNQAQKILRYDASAVVKLVPVRVLDQNRHTVQTFLEGRQNRSQKASAGIIPEKNPQKSIAANRPDMTAILQNCAEYCRKLANSALYFVCQEKIKEEIYEFRSGGEVVMTGGEGAAITYGTTSSLRRRAKINSYVYDYQLVKKGETIEETRTLLEENGRKKDLKNAPLKTQRFFSRKAVFGPVGFFGREWHDVYDYELIKQDRVEGRETYVIKAKPKIPIEGKPNYGTLWVDKTDFSVLKMEVEDQSLAGYEKILEDAKSQGLKPIFTTVHEYEILKNGLRFPSRTVFNEKYLGSRPRGFMQSETVISYENYRFFTVETRVIY